MNEHLQRNKHAWNERARLRKRHTRTVSPEDLRNPVPIFDPEGWMGSISGKDLLCLASGGGLQSALASAAGARTTVVDLSSGMLELDRKIAHENRLQVRTVEASMDDLACFGDEVFDIIVQPVSSCYIQNIAPLYAEVARILKPDGIYISQHKQPVNLQSSVVPGTGGYIIQESYFRSGPLPPTVESLHREADSIEYLHRWDELLGGLCEAGFVIEAMREPRHADPNAEPGSFGHRSCFIPPYIKIKARKVRTAPQKVSILWTP
ncbi:MAG: class I SAM-dependent methyltransferase [Verrucomicrobiales bacterium]